ncbi:ABC transporter substrate-binding protein [Ottowia thiooxydans]|uniref:Branched-chain amino acid transport system substrate-binding protein n=1 Tax=Ottowia thiooxydans TaxID=219182 RepID=A0ABV2QAN9_9BURK
MTRLTIPVRAIAAATTALLAAVAFAQEPGVAAKEILIGEVLMLSGPAAFIGKSSYVGSKLAAAEINATGGINGRQLKVLYEDDGYVPARAVSAVRKLIDVDKVFAITGTTGGSGVTAIMPVIDQAKVPTIVHVAPNAAILEPRRPSVFMIGPDYDVAAYEALRYLVEKQGKAKAKFAVLYQNDDYGKGVLRGFQKAAKDLNFQIVAEVPYQRGAKDFSAEALKIKNSGAEVLYLGTTVTEPGAILSETRRLGVDLTVMGNWAAGLPASIKLASPHGYDYFFNDYYAALQDPAGERFLGIARKHLTADEQQSLSRYSVSGYVAIKTMAEAIRRCGAQPTRTCVTGQLGSMKGFDTGGLSGPISLDNPQGHASPELKTFRVTAKDGSVKAVTDFVPYSKASR